MDIQPHRVTHSIRSPTRIITKNTLLPILPEVSHPQGQPIVFKVHMILSRNLNCILSKSKEILWVCHFWATSVMPDHTTTLYGHESYRTCASTQPSDHWINHSTRDRQNHVAWALSSWSHTGPTGGIPHPSCFCMCYSNKDFGRKKSSSNGI